MAVNKVEVNGETKLDLTQDTVTPENLLSGATAHNAAGERIVGICNCDHAQGDAAHGGVEQQHEAASRCGLRHPC